MTCFLSIHPSSIRPDTAFRIPPAAALAATGGAINKPWLGMVTIPPINMVMTAGWFNALFYPHDTPQTMDISWYIDLVALVMLDTNQLSWQFQPPGTTLWQTKPSLSLEPFHRRPQFSPRCPRAAGGRDGERSRHRGRQDEESWHIIGDHGKIQPDLSYSTYSSYSWMSLI